MLRSSDYRDTCAKHDHSVTYTLHCVAPHGHAYHVVVKSALLGVQLEVPQLPAPHHIGPLLQGPLNWFTEERRTRRRGKRREKTGEDRTIGINSD